MTAPSFVKGPPVPPGGQQETPPKGRGGRPPGRKTAPTAPSRRSLENSIGGMLVFVNLVLLSIPPLAVDALSQDEITALARAIDQQCRQSPRFRKYVEAMLATGSGAGLIGVVIMIGARRAARHGMLPPDMDGLLGTMIAQTVSTTRAAPSEEPVGTGTV